MSGLYPARSSYFCDLPNDACSSIDEPVARYVVQQRLAKLGVPLPESKQSAVATPPTSRTVSCCFGVPLDKTEHRCPAEAQTDVPTAPQSLPGFVALVVQYLERFLTSDGLFRKTGSLQKQRTLRASVCETDGSALEQVSEYDAASLLKQYLRLLPGGVIPKDWRECLTAVANRYVADANQLRDTVLDVVFLLPDVNRVTLQYICSFFHRLIQSSPTMDSERLATILTPSLMQSSTASNDDLNTLTTVLRVIIDNAESVGVPDTATEVAHTLHLRALTPAECRPDDGSAFSSPATEVKGLCQKHSLQSAAASPSRLMLGKCVDSRLMEICSSTESLAATDNGELSSAVEGKLSPSSKGGYDSPEKRKKKKHKRRSSLSGLVTSIGQTFERLKVPKAASNPVEVDRPAPALYMNHPVSQPKPSTPLIKQPAGRRQSLHRAAKGNRGKMAAVHPVPMASVPRPVSPVKRKASSDEARILSPQKRKAMLQSLANNDCIIKSSAVTRMSSVPDKRISARPSMTRADTVTQHGAILQEKRGLNTRATTQGSAAKNLKDGHTHSVLYERSGDNKENSSKKKPARRSGFHVEAPKHGTPMEVEDTDEVKVMALLSGSVPKKQSKLRRRLSGGLLKKAGSEDKVAHIMEVGERIANLGSRPSSRVTSRQPSRCTTPVQSHMRWSAPPGSLPPTNSPTAFSHCAASVPAASTFLASDEAGGHCDGNGRHSRHMSLPRSSALTTGVRV